VERRKAFNVHLYGSHVLKDTTAVSSKKNLIEFVEVVKGQKGEEVARFFLSTLMLVINENVQISTNPGTD